MKFGLGNILLHDNTPKREIERVNLELPHWSERGALLRDVYSIILFAPKNLTTLVFNSSRASRYVPFLAEMFPSFEFHVYNTSTRSTNDRVKFEKARFASVVERYKNKQDHMFILLAETSEDQYNNDHFKQHLALLKSLQAKYCTCQYVPIDKGMDIINEGLLIYQPWQTGRSYITTYVPKNLRAPDNESKYRHILSIDYKRRMFYHHYEERTFVFDSLYPDYEKGADYPELGTDYDSIYETYILQEYLRRTSAEHATMENVVRISHAITDFLNTTSKIKRSLADLHRGIVYRKLDLESLYRGDFKLSESPVWSYVLDSQIRKKNLVCNQLAIYNAAYYIYYYVKTAVYVEIKDNKLLHFRLFSNDNFASNWGQLISSQLKTLTGLSREQYYEQEQSYSNFPGALLPPEKWYLNAKLVNIVRKNERTKEPHGMPEVQQMLEETLKIYKVQDCKFFFNRRDHPLLKTDSNGALIEPYNFVHPSITDKPIRIEFPPGAQFAPVVSPHTDDNFLDIAFPSPYDWRYAQSYNLSDITPWESRENICFFRGSATGAGTTLDTNQRIRAMVLSNLWKNHSDPSYHNLLDAGITNWNIRAKKFSDTTPMSFVKPDEIPFVSKNIHFKENREIVSFTTSQRVPQEQFSKYKYHLYIDGHTFGQNRFTYLMSIGAVILWVKPASDLPGKRFWYEDLLRENDDYLAIDPDFSNLKETILKCKSDDQMCQRLSENVLRKYKNYLQREPILNYVYTFLNHIKNN